MNRLLAVMASAWQLGEPLLERNAKHLDVHKIGVPLTEHP